MHSRGSIFYHKGLKRKKNAQEYPRTKYPLVALFVDRVYGCIKRLVCGHFLLTNSCQKKKRKKEKVQVHSIFITP